MIAIAHSDLTGKLVLNRQTAAKLGTVEQFWLDPRAHQVGGLVCRTGLLPSQRQFIPWSRLEAIGGDSVLVNSAPAAAPVAPPDKSALIIGHELWTDAGDRAGKLVDFLFETETGRVTGYLFAPKGWRSPLDGLYRLPPVALSSVGDQRAIALQAAVEQAEPHQPGLALSQRLQAVKDFLHDDLAATKEHLGTALQDVQTAAAKLRDRPRKALAEPEAADAEE